MCVELRSVSVYVKERGGDVGMYSTQSGSGGAKNKNKSKE